MGKKKKLDDNYKSIFYPRKQNHIITIKTSLKSILKSENYNQDLEKINNLVIECNKIVKEAYQFIRLYYLDQFNKGLQLPKLNADEIIRFINVLGTKSKPRGNKTKTETKTKIHELNNFYENHYKPLFNNKTKFDLKNKTQIILYLAKQMETAYKNNISIHFITRIRRFMNITDPFPIISTDTLQEKDSKKKIFGEVKNYILSDQLSKIPEQYKSWANDIKNNYLPSKYNKNLAYDLKSSPDKYLRYTLKMNSQIEKLNESINNDNSLTSEQKRVETKKLFQCFSLRNSDIPHYITIDTVILLTYFAVKGDSTKLVEGIEPHREYAWSKLFNINKKPLKPRQSLLANDYQVSTIMTDGVGVSIIFEKGGSKRSKILNKKEELKDNKKYRSDEPKYIDDLNDNDKNICIDKKIVAVDPGKGNMVYLYDGEKHLRYTQKQRRFETKSNHYNRIIRSVRENNGLVECETELSKHNSKTTNLDNFKNYIKEKSKVDIKSENIYIDKLFRNLKWKRHINKQRSQDQFLNKIEKIYGKDILLAYGDYDSSNYHMRGVYPSMGIGLRSIIEKKYNIALVNEYKTSKLCCKCEKELVNYKTKTGNKIHRLLVCEDCKSSGSESKISVFINRDRNACINILKVAKNILETGDRPLNFKRVIKEKKDIVNISPKKKKLVKFKIKKKIIVPYLL